MTTRGEDLDRDRTKALRMIAPERGRLGRRVVGGDGAGPAGNRREVDDGARALDMRSWLEQAEADLKALG